MNGSGLEGLEGCGLLLPWQQWQSARKVAASQRLVRMHSIAGHPESSSTYSRSYTYAPVSRDLTPVDRWEVTCKWQGPCPRPATGCPTAQRMETWYT